MFMLTLFLGFILGVLAIVGIEALGVLYVIRRLNQRVEDEEAKACSSRERLIDLDLSSYYNKQGVVWVLELEKVPKSWFVDKVSREQKRKKDVLEVNPVRKVAKIKDHALVLADSDGSHTEEIKLKGCVISAVSATNLSSRKWAKRYPIKVESKTSVILNGSKVFYIYLETSWEKESWCKALRLASFDDKEKLKWFDQVNSWFHSYLASLRKGYPSFMKPSGFSVEPVDRSIKLDDSSSKVRLFLKKLAKKASKSGVENKGNWTSTSGHGGRKINEKSFSFQESLLATASMGKPTNCSAEENADLQASSSLGHSGSKSHASVTSDADSDDKIASDEGTLCWNLLISRLFFDAKSNSEMKNILQARIQRTLSNMRIPSYIGEITCNGVDLGNLPPYIRGMRVLPSDMSEVWAIEVDIEYSGGAMLDIETRVEVRELDFQEGMEETNSESSSVGGVKSDLLEGFEHFGEQLKISEGEVDMAELKKDGDTKLDGMKGFKNSTRAPASASRWKSIINSVAKQVSQVPLTLAIRVTSLRGTMRLYIKPPPSDQIWFGFTAMPDIDFNLESFVGEHKITNGRIALFLISRFKAGIRDTVVLPNCESIGIPWMVAEKDDWVPQKIAPFIWIHQEAVMTDPSTLVCEKPTSQSGEVTRVVDAGKSTTTGCSHLENGGNEKVLKEEPVNGSLNANARESSSRPTKQLSTLEELRTPLLINEEPKETREHSRKEENPVGQSPSSRSIILSEESIHIVEDDDMRPKRMGTRARMLGLGKKMGEKLEERRRTIEEKGRNIVERMRGP